VSIGKPSDALVGAVVLTYRPGPLLARMLESLMVADPGVDVLLIVDNASGDGTVQALRSERPDVEVIELRRNVGYGEAMNLGAGALMDRGCELLLFLTHETIVSRGLVGILRDRMVTRQHLGAVGPLLGRLSDRTTAWSAGGRLTPVLRGGRHQGSGTAMADWVGAPPREVAWLDGACVMARGESFAALGGYREDLFLYWEDVDLCRRLRKAGCGIECVPSAVAYQEPALAPPYLDARNRALVFGRLGVAATACDLALHAAADVLRGRGLGRFRLGARGLRDALAERLDHDLASRRVP
jgi:N-acetylglucosaminyl-diphospho-decaprenol L-rhamnosyltransferase